MKGVNQWFQVLFSTSSTEFEKDLSWYVAEKAEIKMEVVDEYVEGWKSSYDEGIRYDQIALNFEVQMRVW